jgi:hypothetical protein
VRSLSTSMRSTGRTSPPKLKAALMGLSELHTPHLRSLSLLRVVQATQTQVLPLERFGVPQTRQRLSAATLRDVQALQDHMLLTLLENGSCAEPPATPAAAAAAAAPAPARTAGFAVRQAAHSRVPAELTRVHAWHVHGNDMSSCRGAAGCPVTGAAETRLFDDDCSGLGAVHISHELRCGSFRYVQPLHVHADAGTSAIETAKERKKRPLNFFLSQ